MRCARTAGLLAWGMSGCGGDPVRPPADNGSVPTLPGSWAQAAPLPEPVTAAGGAALGGRIYVVGGEAAGPGEASPRALRYDPTANAWERLPDLPEGLWKPGVATLDGTLLVIGGNLHSNQLTPRANVWAWDEAGRSWVYHSLLPIPSTAPRAAGTGSGIIAASLGSLTGAPGDSTAHLARGAASWRYAPPPPMPVSRLAPTTRGAWAVGSTQHTVFDAATGTWAAASSTPSGFVVGAWAASGRRHLVTREATAATHHVFDELARTWSIAAAPQVSSNRIDALSIELGGRLYLIGGTEAGVATTRVDTFTMS